MQLIAERAGIRTYIDNAAAQGIGVGGDSAGGNMTCVIALKLRDEGGPRLALQVPLFPEAAFPADTLAASENRAGLYLESNGIFEMVRNLVKNCETSGTPTLRRSTRSHTATYLPRFSSPTASRYPARNPARASRSESVNSGRTVASAVDVDGVVVLIRHLQEQPEPRRRDRRRAPAMTDERDPRRVHAERQEEANSARSRPPNICPDGLCRQGAAPVCRWSGYDADSPVMDTPSR
jgi:acetyl esterase/lipase